MPELLVPELVENPFWELYRGLIVTSMLHSVEHQETVLRERHQLRRALRYERAAAELGRAAAVAPLQDPAPRSKPVAVPAPIVEPAPAPAVTPAAIGVLPGPPAAAPAAVWEEPGREPATAPMLPVIVGWEPWIGPGIRRFAAAVWLLTLVALVSNIVIFGFSSPATGAADLALIVITLVWFTLAIGDAVRPRARPEQAP